jgi:hypothetical protein
MTRWSLSAKDTTNVNSFSASANDSGIARHTQHLPDIIHDRQDWSLSVHERIDGKYQMPKREWFEKGSRFVVPNVMKD